MILSATDRALMNDASISVDVRSDTITAVTRTRMQLILMDSSLLAVQLLIDQLGIVPYIGNRFPIQGTCYRY